MRATMSTSVPAPLRVARNSAKLQSPLMSLSSMQRAAWHSCEGERARGTRRYPLALAPTMRPNTPATRGADDSVEGA